MKNLEKYNKAYIDGLGVSEEVITEELNYQDIPEWDSVGHMELVAEIEDVFEISMETDDIIDFNSYKMGIELLKKYNVNFDDNVEE